MARKFKCDIEDLKKGLDKVQQRYINHGWISGSVTNPRMEFAKATKFGKESKPLKLITKFLIESNILMERNHYSSGIAFKWCDTRIDTAELAKKFYSYCRVPYDVKSKLDGPKISLTEYELLQDVYFIQDNVIKKSFICGVILNDEGEKVYLLDCHRDSDKFYMKFDKIGSTIDELFNKLRKEFEKCL